MKQLDRTLAAAPGDQLAKKLREKFGAKPPDAKGGRAAPDNEAGGAPPQLKQPANKLAAGNAG